MKNLLSQAEYDHFLACHNWNWCFYSLKRNIQIRNVHVSHNRTNKLGYELIIGMHICVRVCNLAGRN